MREAKERFRGEVKLEERNVQFLLFVNDLMLVAEKEEGLESNLRILNEVMAKCKMKITEGRLRQWLQKEEETALVNIEEVKVMK